MQLAQFLLPEMVASLLLRICLPVYPIHPHKKKNTPTFYNFLKTNNLLHLAQSGFRHIFSCEIALSNIRNKWTDAIHKGLLNGVIFHDLHKAFDLIDHKILLKKLQMYKCSDVTIHWSSSYLYERNQ